MEVTHGAFKKTPKIIRRDFPDAVLWPQPARGGDVADFPKHYRQRMGARAGRFLFWRGIKYPSKSVHHNGRGKVQCDLDHMSRVGLPPKCGPLKRGTSEQTTCHSDAPKKKPIQWQHPN